MDSTLTLIEAILGGYLAAIALQFALGYLITREGRGILMTGDCLSSVYYMQLGLSWMLSAAVGAIVALHFFPLAPMGIIMSVGVSALLAMVLIRSHRKAPHQQTAGASLLLMICIAAGCAFTCFLHLKG
jgi:hypothetical protein